MPILYGLIVALLILFTRDNPAEIAETVGAAFSLGMLTIIVTGVLHVKGKN